MLHFEILEDIERDRTREDELQAEFERMSIDELSNYGLELGKEESQLEGAMNELKLKKRIIINVYNRKVKERTEKNQKNEFGEALNG